LTDYDAFTSLLTDSLRDLSGDKHLFVENISEGNSYSTHENEYDWLQKEKEDEIKYNYGFTEKLKHTKPLLIHLS
jgi:hypothetical protein